MTRSDEQYWPYFVLLSKRGKKGCEQPGMMRFRLLKDAKMAAKVMAAYLGYSPTVCGKDNKAIHDKSEVQVRRKLEAAAEGSFASSQSVREVLR